MLFRHPRQSLFCGQFFFFTVLALPTFWRIWPSVSRNIDTLGGLRDEPPAQSVYLFISFFFLSVPRFFDQDVITDNSFAFQHIFVYFIHLSTSSAAGASSANFEAFNVIPAKHLYFLLKSCWYQHQLLDIHFIKYFYKFTWAMAFGLICACCKNIGDICGIGR